MIWEVQHGRTEPELESILRRSGNRFLWIGPDGVIERTSIADPTCHHANHHFTLTR